MADQTENGRAKRVLVVAARGERPRREVALFVVDKTRTERSSLPLPAETWLLDFSPQGSALAFEVDRSADRHDVWIAPLTQAAGRPRTLLTLDGRRPRPLWAPTGRELLVESRRSAQGSLPGFREHRPWWIVDSLTGRVKRVNPPWNTISAVRWYPQGESLLLVADGALWRWNLSDNSSRRMMTVPAYPRAPLAPSSR